MPTYPTLADLSIRGRRVILRAGFDVPVDNGVVTDDSRVRAILPTMKAILDGGASLVILAHQGRPKGKPLPEFSQRPLVPVLEKLLGCAVLFADTPSGPQTTDMAHALKPGQVLLVENLRYDPREEKNDPGFGRELAELGDLYINDAFTNCHRAHASMVQIPAILPGAIGLQLEEETTQLSRVIERPARPLVLVVSGAKMETKVPIIENFLDSADHIILGGAIANTFLAAKGFPIGGSLYEKEFIARAQDIMKKSEEGKHALVHLPVDVVTATSPDEAASAVNVSVDAVMEGTCIYDLGTKSIDRAIACIEKAGMVVWNGPLGYFEVERFAEGSMRLAKAIAEGTAKRGLLSILGGGDTIDLHERFKLPMDEYTFVSTGGGAMLEFVAGKSLPALSALVAS
jgi:phosphoglycerate kinase